MKLKSSTNIYKKYFLLICFICIFISCGSKQDIVYFQNVDGIGSSRAINNYNSTIHPDDLMTIVVSALDQDAARPFNLSTVSFTSVTGEVGRIS